MRRFPLLCIIVVVACAEILAPPLRMQLWVGRVIVCGTASCSPTTANCGSDRSRSTRVIDTIGP